MPIEILNLDYTPFISILGTAHFTNRSIQEARYTVKNTDARDLAIELDRRRFNILHRRCIQCPKRESCSFKCEFIEASETLGNIDANIWLIDMTELDMIERINQQTNSRISFKDIIYLNQFDDSDLPWLWEQGFKDEVIKRSNNKLEALRKVAPTVWKVLIEERNALMAARLAAITTEKIEKKQNPKILSLVGAAHVKGIHTLLQNPALIKDNLKKMNLTYSPPILIKRIQIQTYDK